MTTITPKLRTEIADFYKKINSGELKTFIPMLSLLRINGQPFTLKRHFFMAPLFDTVHPPQTVLCTARQVAKSTSIAAAQILHGFFIPHYHQLSISPQQDQVQRFNAAAIQPLLKTCPMADMFISSTEANKLSLRTFRNGSMLYLDYCGAGGQADPSRLRGIANIAEVYLDETNWEETPIYIIDKHLGTPKQIPIKDVRAGDFILSCNFCDGSATISVVTKDASFHGYRNYFTVTTKTGRSLTCTADHILPTNHGPMRMGDIIEYVYSRTSGTDRHVRGTSQCNHGESSRGRLSQEQWKDNQGSTLESRPGTGRLRDSQVRNLTRVRYASTVSERESRLRRLLGSTIPEGPSDLSLYVHPAPAGRLREEDRNDRILGRDNAPYSPSLVVHGRRESGQESQYREYPYQWIQRAGSAASLSVVGHSLGYRIETMHGSSQQHRQVQLYDLYNKQGLCYSDGTYISICTGVYGIQGETDNQGMQELWPEIHCNGPELLLFQGVQGNLSRGAQARVLSVISSGTPGRDSCAWCCVQGSTQGGDQAEGARISGKYDRGAAGSQGCTNSSMAEGKSGSYQRGKTRLAQVQERRPGIRSKAEGGTCCILSTQGSGSRETCAYAGIGEGTQKTPRGESAGTGIPEETSCAEAHKRPHGGSEACSVEALPCCSIEARNRGAETGILLTVRTGASRISYGGDTVRSKGLGIVPADAEREGEFFLDPVVKIEYAGVLPGYDIEVEGTHNYVLANGILSKNCQDIPYQYIPIIAEVSSASINWGFMTYAGTPKTTDGSLALLWSRSSQAEWVIRCTHCNHFNIPNPEHDLLKMIGKHYPICAKCGQRIYAEDGGWVHAKPLLAKQFRGLHIAQVTHPLHYINETKWAKLTSKIESYSEVATFNEIFGWPYDAATSPLTLSDLIAAQFDPVDQYGTTVDVKKPADVLKLSNVYSYITIGCDFSGGGPISDSYTAFAVVGLRRDNQVVDVLYGERLPKGIPPVEESRILLKWIEGTGANAFAFDNGGAGFVRLEMMKQMGLTNIPGLTICPETYVAPRGGDIMKLSPAQREPDLKFYTVDKSRSLAMCIAGLKAKRIRVRRFNPEDPEEPVMDFLALVEEPRETKGKETAILITKKMSAPDDFSHAVNFACCQIFDRFGAYIPIGQKYDSSRILSIEEQEPIYGPRGDFDRFNDGFDMSPTVITPDDDLYY